MYVDIIPVLADKGGGRAGGGQFHRQQKNMVFLQILFNISCVCSTIYFGTQNTSRNICNGNVTNTVVHVLHFWHKKLHGIVHKEYRSALLATSRGAMSTFCI
jgi:hypothetical protein